MIGRHDEHDTLPVTKPRAGEKTNCLPHKTFVGVGIYDVAAWMRIG
jgi:hypothetical protein